MTSFTLKVTGNNSDSVTAALSILLFSSKSSSCCAPQIDLDLLSNTAGESANASIQKVSELHKRMLSPPLDQSHVILYLYPFPLNSLKFWVVFFCFKKLSRRVFHSAQKTQSVAV